eukprot:118968_1
MSDPKQNLELHLQQDSDAEEKKQMFDISASPKLFIDTTCEWINDIALIALNILVVFWYDPNRFNRVDVFLAMFFFGYFSSLQGFQQYSIAIILFEIAQFVVYLVFCDFDALPLTVFPVLLVVMLGCKLLEQLVYRYCVDPVSRLFWQKFHKEPKPYKFCGQVKWINAVEFADLFSTVPLFWFNQSRVWGTPWFAVVVVIVLWYHQIMDNVRFMARDRYALRLMYELRSKYDTSCNEAVVIQALKRPMKQHPHEWRILNAIPILYHVLLMVLLVAYLIEYGVDGTSSFEFGYAIFLCVAIVLFGTYWWYESREANKRKELHNDMTLQKILALAKEDPELSDLYGTWVLQDEYCSRKHSITQFTLSEENVMAIDPKDEHRVSCCAGHFSDIYHCKIVGEVQCPNTDEFRTLREPAPLYAHRCPQSGYKFALHKNGIVKFIPVSKDIADKLALARADSYGCFDCLKNVKHANDHSCFCMGMLTNEDTIVRWNRWNADLYYYCTWHKQ